MTLPMQPTNQFVKSTVKSLGSRFNSWLGSYVKWENPRANRFQIYHRLFQLKARACNVNLITWFTGFAGMAINCYSTLSPQNSTFSNCSIVFLTGASIFATFALNNLLDLAILVPPFNFKAKFSDRKGTYLDRCGSSSYTLTLEGGWISSREKFIHSIV